MGLQARASAIGRIELIEAASPAPTAGQVRVRVQRCGICGSDLHYFLGRQPLPTICPGHEASGFIDTVGAQVADWREGDRVAVEPLSRCNECPRCRAGAYQLCRRLEFFGIHRNGAMATDLLVPAYTLFRLPEAVDFELGALAEPTAVGVHALRLAGVCAQSTVLVLGAGTIGLVTVAAARHLGAELVGITARYPHQREAARLLGADEVLEPAEPRMSRRPDIVVETVGGTASTLADGVAAVDHGGTVVMAGLFDEPPAFDPVALMTKEVRLVGSLAYSRWRDVADFDLALEILAQNTEPLRLLVTHTFALTDAQAAFETAADKSTGAVKVMLAP